MEPGQAVAPEQPLRIAVAVGEPSGDLLASGLVARLRACLPHATFAGIAGPRTEQAGVETWFDMRALSVMGLAEVLRHLPRLLRLRRAFLRRLASWQPHVYIGVDAPDFNLAVERRMKERGTLSVHYVSPSIWAWRAKRARHIGACVHKVFCLFPMEPPLYARYGVPAEFVGHPLADAFPERPEASAYRRQLGLEERPTLALLPGSRVHEVQRLGAAFLDAAARLRQTIPQLQVVAPMANDACREVFTQQWQASGGNGYVHLLDGQSHTALMASDVTIVASGTASLEAMLAKRPMVVGYRISPLTYGALRLFRVLRTRQYALPNILAGEPLVAELMQHDCTGERLAQEALPLFQDSARAQALRDRFLELHRDLRHDANDSVARSLGSLLNEHAQHPPGRRG